jgi:hypothetical protein
MFSCLCAFDCTPVQLMKSPETEARCLNVNWFRLFLWLNLQPLVLVTASDESCLVITVVQFAECNLCPLKTLSFPHFYTRREGTVELHCPARHGVMLALPKVHLS